MTKNCKTRRATMRLLFRNLPFFFGLLLSFLLILNLTGQPLQAINKEEHEKLLNESELFQSANQKLNKVRKQVLMIAGQENAKEFERLHNYWLEARDQKAKALSSETGIPLDLAYAKITDERSRDLKQQLLRHWIQKLQGKKKEKSVRKDNAHEQKPKNVKSGSKKVIAGFFKNKSFKSSKPIETAKVIKTESKPGKKAKSELKDPDVQSEISKKVPGKGAPEEKTPQAEIFRILSLWPSRDYK